MERNILKKNRGRTKYDWEALKREFLDSNILEATTFIKGRIGGEKGVTTNMEKHIIGWTEEKKVWKRKKADEIRKKAERALIEKLTVGLADLLLNKRLLFSLDAKYLEILGRMISKNNPPTEEELRFFKNYKESLQDIYKRVQIELGLPIDIKELEFKRKIKSAEVIKLLKKNPDIFALANSKVEPEPKEENKTP